MPKATVEVLPREDKIMVGGRVIRELPLDEGHQFRISLSQFRAWNGRLGSILMERWNSMGATSSLLRNLYD